MTGFDYKGIVFDLDGTLLDSMSVWSKIDFEFLGKRGFEVPKDYVDDIAPLTFLQTAEYTIKRFNLNETAQEVMDEWHRMAQYEYTHNIVLKPHAEELIHRLYDSGKKLVVCTANSPELFVPALERCGVYHMFESVITTDDVGHGKDTVYPFLACIEAMNLTPEECLVFEDVPTAAQCAKDIGCTVWGVYDDVKNIDRMQKICDRFIFSFDEV